tara:strand:+ start:20438 stop:24508 length:4071 start_codon:yes stop_codon:yes gene_type:complete
MSNKKGLLITNNNIYGLVNPPPQPTRRDRAEQYQDISSAAVRWDVFVDFSNNFVGNGGGGGGGGGSGSVNSGKYEEDANGNFIDVTPPTKRDISGIYFDTNKFDVSFNTVSGKENIYVGLKSSGTSLTQDYIDEMFFDPPKKITNSDIELNTSSNTPRLDASWNNPTQRRVAFDFLGTLGPKKDDNALFSNNPYNKDDFNYLPYFQGLKIQYLCYNTDGTKVIGTDWSDVPNTSLNSLPTSRGVNFWNSTSENFLPRFIKKVIIYSNTSTITNASTGIILFPDFTGSGSTNFSINDKNSYAFALPTNVPGVTVSTNGKKIQLRVAMINRAMTSINDPSYNTGHGLSSPDVSWNWVYMPDISGIGIGNYGAPTAPLTFTIPSTPLYDSFILNGQNDNDGTGNISVLAAVVEKELFTPFNSLTLSNPSLPKVRYRYDLSGHRLSNSKQVNGNIIDIDISKNLPDTDVSANWFPSTANTNSNPNTWTDTIDRSRNIAFPEHKYEIYGYSMRYNFDPSRNKPVGYTDASDNNVITSLNKWTTPIPTVFESTNNHSNNGYNETVTNIVDNTVWQETTSSSWTQSKYFVTAGAIKASDSSKTIKTELLFLNNGLDTTSPFNTATTIHLNSGYTKNIRANSDTIRGIDTIGGEIVKIRSNIFLVGETIVQQNRLNPFSTDSDLSSVHIGFQGDVSTGVGSGGYNSGGKAKDVSNNFLGWKTTNIVNAYDKGDLNREGGYYCGLTLSNIDISNVNLINYPDVSNNSGEAGYKAVIYQELSGNSVWSRHPTTIGHGWNKIFNIATRPVEDIEILFSGNTKFILKDGYNGGNSASYSNTDNNFRFGPGSGSGIDPTSNFFGLPLLTKNSQSIIEYEICIENADQDWWPTNNNLIGNLKLYVKGTNSSGVSGHINWNNQTVNKPWSGAGSGTNDFPKLDSGSNPIQTLIGDFDFNGTTTTSFKTHNYSRDLMDTGYSPTVPTPMFYIEADYDNNILRTDRGGSTGSLEAGTRRSLDAACSLNNSSNPINRIIGVGPGSNYTLFWDHTFNTSTDLQRVGSTINSGNFQQYPFVNGGTAPDYTQSYQHTALLHNGTSALSGGDRQLIWAKDGFKPGSWGTPSENPYIDYNSEYWFGNHTTSFTPNYTSLNTDGEVLGTLATQYNISSSIAGTVHKWWNNSTTSLTFTWPNIKWKFMVIKCPVPAKPTNDLVVCLEIKKSSGSYQEIPIISHTKLQTPTTVSTMEPVVWMQEVGTSSTHPNAKLPTAFAGLAKTGWMASHLRFNSSAGQNQKANNNSGCYEASSTTKKVLRLFGVPSVSAGSFDIYFRIGLPNGTNYDISQLKVKYYDWNAPTLTALSGTHTEKVFTYLQ